VDDPQERMRAHTQPQARHMSAPAETRHSEPERTAAHSTPGGRPAEESRSMPHSEAGHAQSQNTEMSHAMRGENPSARQEEEHNGGHAQSNQASNQASERNNDTHITGMHPNSPPHSSPITSSSPARLQSEHQQGMMQL